MILTQNNPYNFAVVSPDHEYTESDLMQLVQDRYADRDRDGYLDIDPDERISDNFRYKELIISDNARKFGLENRVPADRPDIILNARYTAANLLEPCRDRFGGFVPNSWYRGPEVEYAATYRDGFSKYVQKSYRRSNNGEPTVQQLLTIIQSTMYHRDLVSNALKSKTATYSIILNLWDMYFQAKQHPRGEAVDFEIRGSGGNTQLFNWIKSSGMAYDQLILEFHKPNVDPFSGWVHGSVVDPERTGKHNRMSAFSIG